VACIGGGKLEIVQYKEILLLLLDLLCLMKNLLFSVLVLFLAMPVKGQTVSYAPDRFLDIYPVNQADRAPLVLLLHGGGWQSGNKSDMSMWGDTLSALGYPCVAVQYTLSGEGKYPAALVDIHRALDFIEKNASAWGGDRRKIVVLGFSAGGQLAALLGATWHNGRNLGFYSPG
jgi:acetyl esterase/lipase